MNELKQKHLDSREVSEMVGKAHNKLMRDIREYIDQLGASRIGHTEFFTESTYVTSQNKTMPCYLITKKGCEFIAHKLTGTKGTEFTAKYINRFHEMEDVIKNHIPKGKELLALAVLEAQKTIEEQNAKIEEMKPKAIFADAVATSKQSILIGQLAKMICQNGVNIGQRRLFQWMRDNGYLMKQGSSYNMPMQRYVESGLFEIKESSVANPDGSVRLTRTTKVLPKGQIYFINKFLGCETENGRKIDKR